jgi:hypothetical protein
VTRANHAERPRSGSLSCWRVSCVSSRTNDQRWAGGLARASLVLALPTQVLSRSGGGPRRWPHECLNHLAALEGLVHRPQETGFPVLVPSYGACQVQSPAGAYSFRPAPAASLSSSAWYTVR